MGAVVDDAVEERLGLDALAHQAALHVRDGDHERVDAPVPDHGLELLEAGVLGVRLAHGAAFPCMIGAGRTLPAGPDGRRGRCRVGQALICPAATSNSRSISVSSAAIAHRPRP